MIRLSHPQAAVALIELDRAPANVLALGDRAGLLAAFAEIEAKASARAVVLTGRHGAFSTGDDLAEAVGRDRAAQGEAVADFLRMVDAIEACRLPVVAAIDGWCIGGGLELALACDIRLASDRASFACSAVRMGLTASAERLPRLIGEARAKVHLLTGLPFDADRALADGVVAGVHAPAELMAAALDLAGTIAARAPLAVEATKRVASGRSTTAVETAALAASDDHAEARTAFMAKRPPVFRRL